MSTSTSSFGSQKHLLSTKLKFEVEIRPVNKNTIEDEVPIPIAEQNVFKVSGTAFKMAFDLLSGYWQLPIDENWMGC